MGSDATNIAGSEGTADRGASFASLWPRGTLSPFVFRRRWLQRRLVGSDLLVPAGEILAGRVIVFVFLAATASIGGLATLRDAPLIGAIAIVAILSQLPSLAPRFGDNARRWLAIALVCDLPILYVVISATGGGRSPFVVFALCWGVFGVIVLPLWQAGIYGLGVAMAVALQWETGFPWQESLAAENVARLRGAAIPAAIAAMVVIFLALLLASRSAIKTRMALEVDSLHDALTGLNNRRHFEMCLADAIVAAQVANVPFCLGFVDVDHLKELNDSYGHEAGDLAIQAVADYLGQLADSVGASACRFGGDEFGVIFSGGTGGKAGVALAELGERKFRLANSKIEVTVSIGMASGMDRSVLRRADDSLYRAKENRHKKFAAGA